MNNGSVQPLGDNNQAFRRHKSGPRDSKVSCTVFKNALESEMNIRHKRLSEYRQGRVYYVPLSADESACKSLRVWQ